MTRACLALARCRGAATALNASPTYPAAEYDWSLVDLVVVNRGEAVELGGREDPVAAARALREMGAGGVALTLGAAGGSSWSRQTGMCDPRRQRWPRSMRSGRATCSAAR